MLHYKAPSERIRERLIKKNVRFFACDNISEHISEDEFEQLKAEVESKFEAVLHSLVIDTDNDPNSNETAKRLAKMYLTEQFSGRYFNKPSATAFPNEGLDAYKGMLVVRADIKSACAHHWKDVTGTAFIGIIPNGKVIGLSKYTRIAQWCARRGTLQEELTNHIANEISAAAQCHDIAVHIRAEHGCMTCRGVMAHSSLTQTTVLRGQFEQPDVKLEFFDNIRMQIS